MNCNKANIFSNNQIHQQMQASNMSLQGHGLGVLVLPDGETLTLLPQASDLSETVTPAVEESMNQSYSLPSSRLVRFVVPREEKTLSLDKAVINDIKAMRSEWHEREKNQDESDEKENEEDVSEEGTSPRKTKKRLKRLRKSKLMFKKVYVSPHERATSSRKVRTYKTTKHKADITRFL
jgi:hypothetical protein